MPEPLSPGKYRSPEELAEASIEDVSKEVANKPPAVEGEKKPEDSRTPAERWAENLKTAKISEKEALKILDDLCEKGVYEREYKLFQGRMLITLRTREAYARQRWAREVDSLRNPVKEVVDVTTYRLNLAGSLVKYGKPGKQVVLQHPPLSATSEVMEKAFLDRLAFVDGIPDRIIDHVYSCLQHFDMIVFAALSEGAAENF